MGLDVGADVGVVGDRVGRVGEGVTGEQVCPVWGAAHPLTQAKPSTQPHA